MKRVQRQRPQRSRPQLGPLATKVGVATILLALVAVAGALLVGFVRLTWTEHQINQSIARQEAEIQAQRTANEQDKGRAAHSESDGSVEQAAREQLGMAREGETVLRPNLVLQPTPTPLPPVDPATPQNTTLPLGEPPRSVTAANALHWWHALFPGADVRP